jgi:two-component system alkaline phosphatase synthesis response regulator PhoP
MPNQAHILLVEDEKSLSETLSLNLSLEKYQVTVAENGDQALATFKRDPSNFDLVLLDVMLPGTNGYELCRVFKNIQPAIPVIFLTAKNQLADKVAGLRLGADDYITKPFDLEELLLRISNLLKRTVKNENDKFSFNSCEINFVTYEITDIRGERHDLSRREIGLLALLTNNVNKVISRDDIINKLWEDGENASSRTIDNYIMNFRKFFEKNPREPKHFHSVRGVGYKFTL